MEERRLEVFHAVARELSFSRAALILHLSQSAVSQQIAALERELGAVVFDRSRRRVRLTPAGAALLDRVDQLLGQFAEARRAVAAAGGAVEGDLRVAASRTVGTYMLPQLLAPLGRRHPALRFAISIENSERVIQMLLSGQADIGYVEDNVAGPGVVLTPLIEDELLLVAPASHRFARMREVPLHDILTEPLVVRERGSGTRRISEEHLQAAGVSVAELRIAAELAGIESIKAAVETGLGISILSSATLARELALGTLVARRLEGATIRRSIFAVSLAGGTELPAARELTEALTRLHRQSGRWRRDDATG
ncbi:MAG TPA: LysR family transcriptional regulator [Solirubrobacteraceae bacterium]|nr:LysR family transcriptional regulator [Solirubrobacteraceae bacterium]